MVNFLLKVVLGADDPSGPIMVIPRTSAQCLRPTHTGNSRRKQPRGGTGEGTSGDDTLCGWDE